METAELPVDALALNATFGLNTTCIGDAIGDLLWGRTVTLEGCGVLSILAAWLARPVRLSVWPLEAELPWDNLGDVVTDVAEDVPNPGVAAANLGASVPSASARVGAPQAHSVDDDDDDRHDDDDDDHDSHYILGAVDLIGGLFVLSVVFCWLGAVVAAAEREAAPVAPAASKPERVPDEPP
jgi:hypothetical protein